MDTVSYMLGKRAGGGTVVETDPIFSSSPASGIKSNDISNWNNKSDFSGNYNDLTNKPVIPDELSDLSDDSTHRLVTDTEKNTWNDKQDALTAGSNITISGGTISATDTTYSDATTSASGLMSSTDKTKLNGIASGAEVNVQANWNETDISSDSYIQNKPTIPEEMQFSTMPTASNDNLGKIVQFTGTTVANSYTNGYFYKCVSDGQATPTYSWEEVEVQAGGGGASYTAGTNISIDSNNAINCDIPFLLGSSNDRSLALGSSSSNMLGRYSTVVGVSASANLSQGMVVIGSSAYVDGSYGGANDAVIVGQGARASSAGQIAIGRFAGVPFSSQIGYAISLGYKAAANKVNQMMVGSSDANINEIAMYTSNGVKVMATEDYVDNLVGNINTVLATLTTPSNGGNA